MAAVVELLAFDEIVFGGVPAGGLDAPDVAAGLRRHGVEPDAGHGCAASPQLIERGVFFEAAESRSFDLLGGEGGLAFVDVRVRRALERGHARENVCGRVLLGGFAGRRDRVARLTCGCAGRADEQGEQAGEQGGDEPGGGGRAHRDGHGRARGRIDRRLSDRLKRAVATAGHHSLHGSFQGVASFTRGRGRIRQVQRPRRRGRPR